MQQTLKFTLLKINQKFMMILKIYRNNALNILIDGSGRKMWRCRLLWRDTFIVGPTFTVNCGED